MASSSAPLLTTVFTILILSLLKSSITTRASAGICYKSIINFGDSLADTGNLLRVFPHPIILHSMPDYLMVKASSGRFSDGRLVIDFIAESFGLPFVPPYFSGKDVTGRDFREGVNFAVAGATALDESFFRERRIYNPLTNVSLGTQLGWFKDILPSFCSKSSDCKEFLQSSLVLVGEIGGNDYNYALLQGRKILEVQPFVPAIVLAISHVIQEIIELGAVTIVVPGNLPIGCSAAYLTYFQSSDKDDYDIATGCINWLNDFAEYHNKLLQRELIRVRRLYPHATIIYADYYSAAMRLYRSPIKYGFKEGALTACCGAEGPYNYNSSVACGYPPSTTCDDPSLYVSWDGMHLTEAAYRLIARGLLQGSFSNPPISTICNPSSTSFGLSLED